MTTEMHKAPSVAHNTGTSRDNASSVARYDLSTSDGGRRYVADFFARELRRHDFTRYITTTLAADFASALAQHLAARQPGAQEPVAWVHEEDSARVISARQKATALRDQGASGSSVRPYSVPAFLEIQPAQGIDLGQVREIRIPARNNLDPISVFVQDQAAGRGRIVVTCYGNAWQAFWGAMGDRAVVEFVAQCDADYVAGNMISGRQTRMTKAERAYTERIAAEVIAEFRTLIDQRDAAPGVGNG